MVIRQLHVEHWTGKVRRPKTDVLPLCHATSLNGTSISSAFFAGHIHMTNKQTDKPRYVRHL